MPNLELDDVTLHFRDEGDANGPALVFSNSLGTNLHLWDGVVAGLPESLRIIRYDMRGHGESSVPDAPYKMGTLIHDAERLLDHLAVKDSVFVGLSIGGMIAQGLAVKRLDLIRAMVLSNTAAKIGTAQMWQDRISLLRAKGLGAMANDIMLRWFSRGFRDTPALGPWKEMLLATPEQGYAGCAAAIAGTDFYTQTAGLRLPTLGIAGSEDGATPPDLVRETLGLIPGSRFELIRGAGHLPCAEVPDVFTQLVLSFLREIGHI